MTRLGFTDRNLGGEDRHPHAPRDARASEMLAMVVNLHQDRPKAILVSSTADGEVGQAWLAKTLIRIEPAKALGPHGVTLRIHVPRWLAEEKGLASAAGEGQGVLL